MFITRNISLISKPYLKNSLHQSYIRSNNSFLHKSYRSFHWETTKTINFDQVYNASIANQKVKDSMSSNSQDSSDNSGNSSSHNFDGSTVQTPVNQTSFIMMLKMEEEKDKIESDLSLITTQNLLKTFALKNYKLIMYYTIRFITFFLDLYKEYILIFWLFLFL